MKHQPAKLLLLLVALAAAGLAWQQCVRTAPALPDGGPTPPASVTAPPAARPAEAPPAKAPPAVDRVAAPARTDAAAVTAHAEAAQGVRGRIVDGRGQAIAGAQAALIESHSNDPIGRFMSLSQNVPTLPAAAATSAADGAFALGLSQPSTRDYELCLWTDGFASETVDGLRVRSGEWVELGDITLQPGTAIRGRVTVAGTDLPVPQATVWLESGDPFFDLGPGQLDGWRQRRSTAVDADGRYELRDAPRQGLFRLCAAAPGFGRQIDEQLELADGVQVVRDFALPRGLSILGRLRTGGRPLAGARIIAYAPRAEPEYRGTVASDGSFALHGLREGLHLVKIAADGFQPLDLPDVPAGTQDLVVDLVPRASAAVVVRGDRGVLLARYRLGIRRWFADGGTIAAVHDVPDRVIHLGPGEDAGVIDGLDPGSYVFQVVADGYASTLSPPFEIEAGGAELRVDVTMVHGGRLTGTVVDDRGAPVAGAALSTQPQGAAEDNPVWKMLHSLTPDRITRATATTDANGRYELGALAHAEYQLRVDHPDFCRSIVRDLRVDGDHTAAVLPIRLVRGAAVRGRALVNGQPSAQVRVVLTPATAATDEFAPPDAVPPPVAPTKTRDETSVDRVEAVTNQDGSFALPRRVPPGTYELRGLVQVGSNAAADAFQKLTQMQHSAVKVIVPPGQDSVAQDLYITTDR